LHKSVACRPQNSCNAWRAGRVGGGAARIFAMVVRNCTCNQAAVTACWCLTVTHDGSAPSRSRRPKQSTSKAPDAKHQTQSERRRKKSAWQGIARYGETVRREGKMSDDAATGGGGNTAVCIAIHSCKNTPHANETPGNGQSRGSAGRKNAHTKLSKQQRRQNHSKAAAESREGGAKRAGL
jgi:hypothetical protein